MAPTIVVTCPYCLQRLQAGGGRGAVSCPHCGSVVPLQHSANRNQRGTAPKWLPIAVILAATLLLIGGAVIFVLSAVPSGPKSDASLETATLAREPSASDSVDTSVPWFDSHEKFFNDYLGLQHLYDIKVVLTQPELIDERAKKFNQAIVRAAKLGFPPQSQDSAEARSQRKAALEKHVEELKAAAERDPAGPVVVNSDKWAEFYASLSDADEKTFRQSWPLMAGIHGYVVCLTEPPVASPTDVETQIFEEAAIRLSAAQLLASIATAAQADDKISELKAITERLRDSYRTQPDIGIRFESEKLPLMEHHAAADLYGMLAWRAENSLSLSDQFREAMYQWEEVAADTKFAMSAFAKDGIDKRIEQRDREKADEAREKERLVEEKRLAEQRQRQEEDQRRRDEERRVAAEQAQRRNEEERRRREAEIAERQAAYAAEARQREAESEARARSGLDSNPYGGNQFGGPRGFGATRPGFGPPPGFGQPPAGFEPPRGLPGPPDFDALRRSQEAELSDTANTATLEITASQPLEAEAVKQWLSGIEIRSYRASKSGESFKLTFKYSGPLEPLATALKTHCSDVQIDTDRRTVTAKYPK